MRAYHTYKAIDVAYGLLAHAYKQGKKLTNLQLQKLVYVCHGLSLAQYQRPLIIEDVSAWKYGPVIPSVYFHFKSYGSDCIPAVQHAEHFDSESDQIIESVIAILGSLSGPQLVSLTHRQGSPWHSVWDGSQRKIIPDAIICQHYQEIQRTGRTTSL